MHANRERFLKEVLLGVKAVPPGPILQVLRALVRLAPRVHIQIVGNSGNAPFARKIPTASLWAAHNALLARQGLIRWAATLLVK